MKYLKAIWEFCSFLFVPQWGRHPKDVGTAERLRQGMTNTKTKIG